MKKELFNSFSDGHTAAHSSISALASGSYTATAIGVSAAGARAAAAGKVDASAVFADSISATDTAYGAATRDTLPDIGPGRYDVHGTVRSLKTFADIVIPDKIVLSGGDTFLCHTTSGLPVDNR